MDVNYMWAAGITLPGVLVAAFAGELLRLNYLMFCNLV